NDAVKENDDAFFVNLSNLTGATFSDSQARGTILNDDWPSVSINDVTVAEGDFGTTAVTFTVTLSYSLSDRATVNWATADGTAAAARPTPPFTQGDYVGASGTLTFTSGQTSKTFTVNVRGDVKMEPTEAFFVNLSNPSKATIADGQGVVTITDNDPYVL